MPTDAFGLVGGSWVVDVWTDSDDLAERVRLLGQGDTQFWAEVRFIEDGCSNELPSPGASNSFRSTASCPELLDSPFPFGQLNSDWQGFEAWTPTMNAPFQVLVDPAGNAYDVGYWADVGPFDQTMVGSLTIVDGQVQISELSGWTRRSDAEPSPTLVHFDPIDGAKTVSTVDATIFSSAKLPGYNSYGVRLDVPGSSVATWSDFNDLPYEFISEFVIKPPLVPSPVDAG